MEKIKKIDIFDKIFACDILYLKESTAPTEKQTVAATLEEDAITLDTKIDVSKGYSVVFYRNSFF